MTQKTVREKIEGIVDGYSYNPKHATDKILKVIEESLPGKKKNRWYRASGQDFYGSDDAYKDGECNGFNKCLADVKERLGVSEIKH